MSTATTPNSETVSENIHGIDIYERGYKVREEDNAAYILGVVDWKSNLAVEIVETEDQLKVGYVKVDGPKGYGISSNLADEFVYLDRELPENESGLREVVENTLNPENIKVREGLESSNSDIETCELGTESSVLVPSYPANV